LVEYKAAPYGEKSAVLRRGGTYQTHVAEWASARDAAAAGEPYRRDRKPWSKDLSASAKLVKSEAEDKRLARQLEQTQAALDVMGKAHRLLELLSMSDDESHPQVRNRR
jgi:transposase